MSLQGILRISTLLLLLIACREDPGSESTSPEAGGKVTTGWHYRSPAGSISSVDRLYLEDGLYHLFYSCQPSETSAKSWGHTVSTDLYSWKDWTTSVDWDSIVPFGSRSLVSDPLNRSGLGTPDEPPLLAYFSYTEAEGDEKRVGLAHSLDGGSAWSINRTRTFKGLDSESVSSAPRVFWWGEEEKFVATVRHADRNEIRILESEDGWDWVQQGRFSFGGLLDPGSWDRAELFRISEGAWGLLVNVLSNGPNGGSGTAYILGDFNGREFRADGGMQWLDYGPDNYSGSILWNETTSSVIYIGVMNNSLYHTRVPRDGRGYVLTLPRELHLTKTRVALNSRPVRPLGSLNSDVMERHLVVEGNAFRFTRDTLAPISLTIKPGKEGFRLNLSSVGDERLSLYTVPSSRAILLDRMSSGLTSFEPEFGNKKHYIPLEGLSESDEWEVEVYLDQSSVEVFVDGGKRVFSALVFPRSPYRELTFSNGENGL